ncbi:MAG: hypothetical protein GXO77_01285 [Calditrichaeota bacterium]|nr:hypothetical protein [Calditrichota bacterium]
MKRIIAFFLIVFVVMPLMGQEYKINENLPPEVYLIGNGDFGGKIGADSVSEFWSPVFCLDGTFIAMPSPDSSFSPLNFTRSVPLAAPIDSILELYFKSSRAIKQAEFIVTLTDTCSIQPVKEFKFITYSTPLKEINLFRFNSLIQDEIYIDPDLTKISDSDEIGDILFFEFYFRQFLLEKVVPGRIYSEPVLTALSSSYRPIYAPEVHFFLDPASAREVVKNWTQIKRSFKRSLSRKNLQLKYELFQNQFKLITETPNSRIVLWLKLMNRYGSRKPLVGLVSGYDFENLNFKLREYIDKIYMLWFRSEEIDSDLLKELKEQNPEGGFRIY